MRTLGRMRGTGFLYGNKRMTADLSEGERPTPFLFAGPKRNGFEFQRKRARDAFAGYVVTVGADAQPHWSVP